MAPDDAQARSVVAASLAGGRWARKASQARTASVATVTAGSTTARKYRWEGRWSAGRPPCSPGRRGHSPPALSLPWWMAASANPATIRRAAATAMAAFRGPPAAGRSNASRCRRARWRRGRHRRLLDVDPLQQVAGGRHRQQRRGQLPRRAPAAGADRWRDHQGDPGRDHQPVGDDRDVDRQHLAHQPAPAAQRRGDRRDDVDQPGEGDDERARRRTASWPGPRPLAVATPRRAAVR